MARKYVVVAGIGTEVGKTVASAVLSEVLEADYWKPIVSGADDGPIDPAVLKGLLRNPDQRIHPSTYVFGKSLSPHIAAELDGDSIQLKSIIPPVTYRPIVIELAGGLSVPLNDDCTNLDLLAGWKFPIVLVSRHYLGSINHTLLSLEALRAREIPVLGVLFNGEELPDTERIIAKLGRIETLGRIPPLPTVTHSQVTEVASNLRQSLLLRLNEFLVNPTQL